jgi:hypothetical protein
LLFLGAVDKALIPEIYAAAERVQVSMSLANPHRMPQGR